MQKNWHASLILWPRPKVRSEDGTDSRILLIFNTQKEITMKPFTYALALMLPLTLAAPGFAQNVTVTTGKGGTMTKNRSCMVDGQMVICDTMTTGTTAGGQTVSRNRQRTVEQGGSTTTVTGTGPSGESNTRTRTLLITR